MICLGLTGPNAAGKGEVAAYFAGQGFRLHSLSDIVREEASRRGLLPEREHLIRVGNLLRGEGGSGVLAARIVSRLGRRDVVDSIRNPAEVEVLRGLERFVLVGVTAPSSSRFDRMVERGRAGDPLTRTEFEGREAEENTSDPGAQQLDATFRLADHVIDNDGDLVQLHRRLDALLARIDAD